MSLLVSAIQQPSTILSSCYVSLNGLGYLIVARSLAIEIYTVENGFHLLCKFHVYAGLLAFCHIIMSKEDETNEIVIVVLTRDHELLALAFGNDNLLLLNRCALVAALPLAAQFLLVSASNCVLVHTHIGVLWSVGVSLKTRSFFAKPVAVVVQSDVQWHHLCVASEQVSKFNSVLYAYLVGVKKNVSMVTVCKQQRQQRNRWTVEKQAFDFPADCGLVLSVTALLMSSSLGIFSKGVIFICEKAQVYTPPTSWTLENVQGFKKISIMNSTLFYRLVDALELASQISVDYNDSDQKFRLKYFGSHATASYYFDEALFLTLSPAKISSISQKRDRIGRYFQKQASATNTTGTNTVGASTADANSADANTADANTADDTSFLWSQDRTSLDHTFFAHYTSLNHIKDNLYVGSSPVADTAIFSVPSMEVRHRMSITGPVLDVSHVTKVPISSSGLKSLVPCAGSVICSASGALNVGHFSMFYRGLATKKTHLKGNTDYMRIWASSDNLNNYTVVCCSETVVDIMEFGLDNQFQHKLSYEFTQTPTDVIFIPGPCLIYDHKLKVISSKGIKDIGLPPHNVRCNSQNKLWLYHGFSGKLYTIDSENSISEIELPFRVEDSVSIACHVEKNFDFVYVVVTDSVSAYLTRVNLNSQKCSKHKTMKLPYPLISIHLHYASQDFWMAGSSFDGSLYIVDVKTKEHIELKISSAALSIRSSGNLFFLKSKVPEVRQVTVVNLIDQNCYDLGYLDTEVDDISVIGGIVFALRNGSLFSLELQLPNSAQIFKPMLTTVGIEGLPLKFAVIESLAVAVVVATKLNHALESIGSYIYVISLKSPFKVVSSLEFPEFELLDVVHTPYAVPQNSNFQDRTALPLQNMLRNTVVVLCAKGDTTEFKLLSITPQIKVECSFENTIKSRFCAVANYGHRLFTATGNKTGFFRISFTPSSSEFFIERAFEKKLTAGFTSSVYCEDNTIVLNDILYGSMNVRIERISYTLVTKQSGAAYTVKDYSLANNYEDYEMSVRLTIDSIHSLHSNSLYSIPGEISHFINRENKLEQKGFCFHEFRENVNCLVKIENGDMTKELCPLSLVATVGGGIYVVGRYGERLSNLVEEAGRAVLNEQNSDIKGTPIEQPFEFADGSILQTPFPQSVQKETRQLNNLLLQTSMGFILY